MGNPGAGRQGGDAAADGRIRKQITEEDRRRARPLDTNNNQMELEGGNRGTQGGEERQPGLDPKRSPVCRPGDRQVSFPAGKAAGGARPNKKPVPNKELWEELDGLGRPASVTWERVSGKDHPITKEVDRLAKEAARRLSPVMRSGCTTSCAAQLKHTLLLAAQERCPRLSQRSPIPSSFDEAR